MTEEHKKEMLRIFRIMLADKHIYIFEKRRTGKVTRIFHIKVLGIYDGVWDFTPLLLDLLEVKGNDLKTYSKMVFVKLVCEKLEELGYTLPERNYEIISDNIRWIE